MNIGILYVITAWICMLQVILILNRTQATKYKETIDRPFCNMLRYFALFIFVDSVWGFCFSGVVVIAPVSFTFVSYLFHIVGAVSSFIWFGYMIFYVKAEGKERIILSGIRGILLLIQSVAIGSNLWTGNAFRVDEHGNYITGRLRETLYVLQFCYYIILIAYCAWKWFAKKENKKVYHNMIVFSFVPLFFGILQYLFYDAAMYSLGFTLSAFVIYSFNVTAQRESFMREREENLKQETNRLSVDVYIDALTGIYNRRSYEEDMKQYANNSVANNFVYLSLDLNGLKVVNDNIGHEAGDEMLKGTVFCMNMAFGAYGKLYRVGGDEFAAIIFATEDKLHEITEDFEQHVKNWSGELVKELSVSWGCVTGRECPDARVEELAKLADKRMYQKKSAYYSGKGSDRRAQQDMYSEICRSFTIIFKVNLTEDQYSIVKIEESENVRIGSIHEKFSDWMRQYMLSAHVCEADWATCLERTDLEYLRSYFRDENMSFCQYYRREIETEYQWVMLEMIRAADYTDQNQMVFFYVKTLKPLGTGKNGFFTVPIG